MLRAATVHTVTAIGIDMGKNTLHMIGLDPRGAIVLREKVSRGRITSRLANLPPCLIGIEAGMATHYVARELARRGCNKVKAHELGRECKDWHLVGSVATPADSGMEWWREPAISGL